MRSQQASIISRLALHPSQHKEHVISELEKLRMDFIRVFDYLEKDCSYQTEYKLFAHHQYNADKPYHMTSSFERNVVLAFHQACQRYDKLRDELRSFITSNEIYEIENSVLTIASDEKKLADLYYFPTYQSIHTANIAPFNAASEQLLTKKKLQKAALLNQYAKRSLFYQEWHLITGLLTLGMIGAPFFVGGLIVHTLDKLITKLRTLSLNKSIAHLQVEAKQHRHPHRSQLDKNIQHDADIKIRQRFFEVVKTRHQPSLHALEREHTSCMSR